MVKTYQMVTESISTNSGKNNEIVSMENGYEK